LVTEWAGLHQEELREAFRRASALDLSSCSPSHCRQLEPAVEDAGLARKGGAIVFRSHGSRTVTADMVEALREERRYSWNARHLQTVAPEAFRARIVVP
jgi:hypothetical protein